MGNWRHHIEQQLNDLYSRVRQLGGLPYKTPTEDISPEYHGAVFDVAERYRRLTGDKLPVAQVRRLHRHLADNARDKGPSPTPVDVSSGDGELVVRFHGGETHYIKVDTPDHIERIKDTYRSYYGKDGEWGKIADVVGHEMPTLIFTSEGMRIDGGDGAMFIEAP